MPIIHRRVLSLLAFTLACGSESEPEPRATPEDAPETAKPADDAAEPTREPPVEATPEDPFEAGDWGDEVEEPEAGGEEAPTPAAEAEGGNEAEATNAEPFRGPCKIRWIEGPIVRLTYEDDQVSVRIDTDGDGKSDQCATTREKDGQTTSVSMDVDCNRKTDFRFSPEHADDANLATARYTETVDGSKKRRNLTLVELGVFSGSPGGYPLYAKRSDIEWTIEEGRVKKATVASPEQGPPVAVEFVYDDDGRIDRINEDIDADGVVDRRFDYGYDDIGNVERMRFIIGRGEAATKGFARIDYRCWEDSASEE